MTPKPVGLRALGAETSLQAYDTSTTHCGQKIMLHERECGTWISMIESSCCRNVGS
jgi:hypothetical protein